MALTQSAHILLVARRDPQDPIRRILRGAGYPVVSSDSPSTAVRTAKRVRPAVIIADSRALTPVGRDDLVAFAGEQQIPLVLNWADPTSLVGEVEKLVGRRELPGRQVIQLVVGSLQVDVATHVARVGEELLDLTGREFDLLCHFARHPGWVWSRQELLEQVWGYDYGDPRVVTVHIANLRRKLDTAAPGSRLIETVRNIGYKLVTPSTVDEATSIASRPPRAATDAVTEQAPPVELPETEVLPSVSRVVSAGALDEVGAAEPHEEPGVARQAGAIRLEDERRLVTVLFADIGGLATLVGTRDPESLRDLLDALFERVVPCIENYGGKVDTFIGDRVMALFGAPVAHDNDAEMAVRAALDIRSAVASFGEGNRIEGLSVQIGINTGVVVAGSVGVGTVKEYSVIGDTVNVASRLAEVSGPGEVLVGPETFRLAGTIVVAQPAEKVNVRGRADEVPCYRVEAIGQGRGAGRTAAGIDSVLVGREEQLALFRGLLDRLDEGIGSVIFVIGEAGVGKSRLTAEVHREAASRRLKWLEGRTLSYGQAISYLPFKEILQTDCGIGADDPATTRERKLRERLERLFADRSGEFLPVLGNLLGLSDSRPPEYQPERPDEENTRRILLDRLTRYVSRLGTEEPVILVFEDVHWLDKSSATLIEKLLPLTARAPVTVCLVGRGDAGSRTLELLEAARAQEDLRPLEVVLPALSGKQTHELVRNLLGGSEIEPRISRMIEQRSQGNPFFVEEIIRHMIDSGLMRRDELGAWEITSIRMEVAIPGTLQGVIRARIDGLPEATKQELLRASVIGRSFFYELLRSLSPAHEEEFNRHLSYLKDHQLIFVKRREPELEYAFKHALVQEAAYESILIKQRRELHRQVARAIEDLFSGRVKDLYGILAYQYTKAEDWENAQSYLLKAGDQSVSMAADAEAVAQYEEAMAALLRAFDESWDEPGSHDRVSWFVRRTEPFWLARCLGNLLDSAQVFYDRVSTACGPADPRTLAATTIVAGCYYQRGLYDRAADFIDQALQALEQANIEDDPSLSRLLLLLGLCRLNTDRFSEAEEVLARALALENQKTAGEDGVLQDLYIYLSSAHFLTGQHDELRRVTEEALRKFDLAGSQRYWMLLLNLCSASLVLGNWDEAAALAQQCVDGITSPYLRADAARHLGEIRHAQGVYLEAEEHLRYSVATFEEYGSVRAEAEALKDLAETLLQAGKPDRAEQTAQKAIGLMEAALSPNYSDIAAACWTLAGVEMDRGRLAEADRLLQRSAEIVDEKYARSRPFRAELHFRRAQLRADQGRTVDAEQDLNQAIQLLADIGGEDHPRIGQMKAEWQLRAAQPQGPR